MTVNNIFTAVLALDESMAVDQTQVEIDAGTAIDAILNDGLIGAMDEVGDRFSAGDLFVPEMLRAAQVMKAGLELLKPHMGNGATRARGQW
jgi:5-methyltetrahydrofolate--homocysteine methyltransferase